MDPLVLLERKAPWGLMVLGVSQEARECVELLE